MKKSKNKILSFIISLSMFLSFLPVQVFGSSVDTVTLEISNGAIEIYPHYYIQNGIKTDFSGDYILKSEYVGTESLIIFTNNNEEVTYNIKLDNIRIDENYRESVVIDNPNITVNFTVEGENNLSTGGLLSLRTNGSKVNFNILKDSNLNIKTYGYPGKAIDNVSNVTINDETKVFVGNFLDMEATLEDATTNRYVAIKYDCHHVMDNHQCTKCNYNIHEYVGVSISEEEHEFRCSCGDIIKEDHLFYEETITGNTCTTEGSYIIKCYDCDYESELITTPAYGHNYSSYEDYKYHYKECVDCHFIEKEEHNFKVVDTIEESQGTIGYDLLQCSQCRFESKNNLTIPQNSLYFELYDDFGDGWNDAYLEVIINGVSKRIEVLEDYSYNEVITYNSEDLMVVKWHKGDYDSECIVNIYNKDGIVYSKENFEEVNENEVVFYNNTADYTVIEEALAQVPKDLSMYTADSIINLQNVINSVDYYLGKKDQNKVNEKAEEIKNAISNLVLSQNPGGVIDLTKGNLVITESGYTLGDLSVNYTGDYFILGNGNECESTISVLSGKHNITIMNLNISGYLHEDKVAPGFGIYSGEVNLTLFGNNTIRNLDGWDIACNSAAVYVDKDAKLTISKESTGVLNALSLGDGAAIGGNYVASEPSILNDCGTIIINGGTINAISGDDGAGIGGAYRGGAGYIEINGGNITAESDSDGAGIGSGYKGNETDNGKIVINGGNIKAVSYNDGAGIGNGEDAKGLITVIINGGNIYAYGNESGAGIGGGDTGYAQEIIINGGYIEVKSNESVAIGGGDDGMAGKITINGGIINVLGYDTYIMGAGPYAYDYDMEITEDNFIHINGGNILSDNPSAINMKVTNSNGETLHPVEFTTPEGLENSFVTISFEGKPESYIVQAVEGKAILYLPEGLTLENSTVIETLADYTEVDSAIASVPSDLSIYTDESVASLNKVLNSIDRNLNLKDQAIVDGYVLALNEVINGLVKKEVTPTEPEKPVDPSNPSGSITTGDESPIRNLFFVMFLSGIVLFTIERKERKIKNNI